MPDAEIIPLPTIEDVKAAAGRIKGLCLETPLLESPYLNQQLGGRLLVKAENLQITGSFKLRGATNRIAMLSEEEKRRGIIARSSGNHGLAVAYCAHLMETPAVVVIPDTAPATKAERIKAYGARVVQVPMSELAETAKQIEVREKLVYVAPADDFWVVAGAGTVGMEIADQAAARGIKIDAVLASCSGGGLAAGCLIGLGDTSPGTKVYAVEAAGSEKMAQSLAGGRRVNLQAPSSSICDAITGLYTAEIPFEIIRPRLAGTFAVTDEEVQQAMRAAFSELGLAVEPGGAAALAAVLAGRMPVEGRTVVVVLSGRNVDLPLASSTLGRQQRM